MAFQNFEEVWAALGRLYDDIAKLQESQQKTTAQQERNAIQIAEVTGRIDRLAEAQERTLEQIDRLAEGHERVTSMLATLAGTVTQLAGLVDSHERRLARMEGQ